jgi:hypothetical protein
MRTEIAQPPTPLRAELMRSAPFFVVGCQRSGTTLLRFMLDCHPKLAVPRESHFLVTCAPGRFERWDASRSLERILGHPLFWSDGDRARIEAVVADERPSDYVTLLRAVFASYAEADGKVRWGDKTPGHVAHMNRLAKLFPDARFIHLIRDGRDVSASIVERPWGPPNPSSAAFWWRRKVAQGRDFGRRLGPGRYLEVHYEDLVERTEETLRRICRFIGEEYDPLILGYPTAAVPKIQALDPAAHHGLVHPPRRRREDWREGLTRRQIVATESVCRRRLAELGYEPGPRSTTAFAYAVVAHAWYVVRTARLRLGRRLRPRRRRERVRLPPSSAAG